MELISFPQKYNFFMGLSAGDEGKGCVFTGVLNHLTTNLPEKLILVRCNGGANAGNSVIIKNNDGSTTKKAFHAFPAVTNLVDLQKITAIIVFGTEYVFNPSAIINEIEFLRNIGYLGKIIIGDNVTVTLKSHIEEDQKNLEIGSTAQGVGTARIGRLERNINITNSLLQVQNAIKNLNSLITKIPDEDYEIYKNLFHKFNTFNVEIYSQDIINNLMDSSNTTVIVCGAHGAGIALESFRQPYVTTSDIFPYSAFVKHCRVDKAYINGIFKLPYMTRVGTGISTPYHPTSEEQAIFALFAFCGNEYGSTTKRLRKICWNNLAEIKKYINMYKPDSISLTKIDMYDEIYNEINLDYPRKSDPQFIEIMKLMNVSNEHLVQLREQLLNNELFCKFIINYKVDGIDTIFPSAGYAENDVQEKFTVETKNFKWPTNANEILIINNYVSEFLNTSILITTNGPQFNNVDIKTN